MRPIAMTIRWGLILLVGMGGGGGRVQAQDPTSEAGEQKPEPVSCGACHWGQETLRVQDFWQPGMEAEAAVAPQVKQHPEEAVVSIRRSLDTTHNAIVKAKQILEDLETTTDIPVESLKETVESAENQLARLQEAVVSTDQETIADSTTINLKLQKVWSSLERTRDERKSRVVFSILVLATVVFLLATLAGLKHFIPEPVVLPEEEMKEEED